MSKPEIEKVSANTVPDVRDFLKHARAVEEWKAEFPEAAAKLAAIAGPYNAAHKAAEAVTKAARISCGPFVITKFATNRYDWAALADHLGTPEFQRLGGTVSDAFAFDSARFPALSSRLKLPEDVVDKVSAWTPFFDRPALISIP